MNTEVRHHPDWSPPSTAAGVHRFPVTACGSAEPCPVCRDCATDCADCVLCEQEACPRCRIPDLTPRTAKMLVVAGLTLAGDLRSMMLAGPRPVFLHHLARTFETLTAQLERGDRPRPGTLAGQLCVHLMIRYATELSCGIGETLCTNLAYSDYDYYFDRLYDTLLPDDLHQPYVEETLHLHGAELIFDFGRLAETVSRSETPGALFAATASES